MLNLVLGARIIRSLAAIPNTSLIDRDHWRAVRLLGSTVTAIAVILALGLVMFNRAAFGTLFNLVFSSGTVKREEVWLMSKTFLNSVVYLVCFVLLSVGTVLFCYSMEMFEQNVQLIVDGLKNGE